MKTNEFEFAIVFYPQHNFYWATFGGDLSLRDLAQAHQKLLSQPNFDPSFDELLDFSNASIKQLGKKEIGEIRRYMQGKTDLHHNRSVIVVNSQLEFGLGRMMGALMDQDVPVDRWICYSVEEALEWLRPTFANDLLAEHVKAQQVSRTSRDQV